MNFHNHIIKTNKAKFNTILVIHAQCLQTKIKNSEKDASVQKIRNNVIFMNHLLFSRKKNLSLEKIRYVREKFKHIDYIFILF